MSGRFFDYGLISKKTQLHHVYITAFKGDKILYYKMQDDDEIITINDVINAIGKDEYFTIFAESFLDGVLIKYNPYGDRKCYVVANTRGFA